MKSRSRFAIALTLAAVLGGWLIWTSIGGSLETYTSPSGLVKTDGTTYRLNGRVNPGYGKDPQGQAQTAAGLDFVVRDKDKPSATVTVKYHGQVPDAFTVNREVVVTGHMQDGAFVADRGSLITLCPSKFTMQKAAEEGKTMPGGVPKSSQGTAQQ